MNTLTVTLAVAHGGRNPGATVTLPRAEALNLIYEGRARLAVKREADRKPAKTEKDG